MNTTFKDFLINENMMQWTLAVQKINNYLTRQGFQPADNEELKAVFKVIDTGDLNAAIDEIIDNRASPTENEMGETQSETF